jgi:hypothetical protein
MPIEYICVFPMLCAPHYKALTGWALLRRRNEVPVRHELTFIYYLEEIKYVKDQNTSAPSNITQWLCKNYLTKLFRMQETYFC